MATKFCTRCGETKPLDEFHKCGRRGRQSSCKACRRQAYLKGQPSKSRCVCVCGCGKSFLALSKSSRYIPGHQRSGKRRSERTRQKISEALTGRTATGAQLEALKLGRRFQPGEVQKPLTQEQELRRRKSLSLAMRGRVHTGRMARDNAQHCRAKSWRIESPEGKHYRFSNMHSWCRKNEHLFENGVRRIFLQFECQTFPSLHSETLKLKIITR